MNKYKISILAGAIVILTMGCSENEDNTIDNDIDEHIEETDDMFEDEVEEDEVDDENLDEPIETDDEIVDEVEEEEIEEIEPQYEMTSHFSVVPIEGTDAPENVVLLTIDDSFLNMDSDTTYALEMAEILYEQNANAIFFINGQGIQSEEDEEKLRTIHEMGFEIGNHTMNHENLNDLSEEEQRSEIIELNDLIEEITGERPRFFRAPFGANTDISKQVMEEEGMQWMNWTYGYDWESEYREAEALAEIMVETKYLRDGANLLMHDRDFTRDALVDIVEGLREKGYEIVDPKLIK
ncbi:polysaccharide deacetylase family protein [Evansella cellulosilytica]|uniref:Polysaccharide deacetylase n=1 Tax=Evansella cellulosilytica (strain ATCC 21833 / DSM 2522 / FERM P-1141 / JCM 9156 / N-4) TaxID=649639 RepID=E6TUM7_EVAC2|nr:polysaccharide deacetylase family protein [Evansella cellulosilytica]ADU30917.1 polysaccharide deacetylase [Evansella cellulosilytica DSM 2522]